MKTIKTKSDQIQIDDKIYTIKQLSLGQIARLQSLAGKADNEDDLAEKILECEAGAISCDGKPLTKAQLMDLPGDAGLIIMDIFKDLNSDFSKKLEEEQAKIPQVVADKAIEVGREAKATA